MRAIRPVPSCVRLAALALLAFASGPGAARAQGPVGPGGPPPSGRWVRLGQPLDPGVSIPAPIFEHRLAPPVINPGPGFWIVHTRGTSQVMGSEPWPGLEVLQFDPAGCRAWRGLGDLIAASWGRPVVIVIHGNGYDHPTAVTSAVALRATMTRQGSLPPGALLVVFDWPSEKVIHHPLRDLDEKARRSFVAGYHLARFVQAFPIGSRICLVGHSYGSTAIGTALHLLGGGAIDSQAGDPPVALPGLRPDLRIRAVLLAAAIDHDWLDPGARMGCAWNAAEAIINVQNHRDRALIFYPFSRHSDHRRALGQVGLRPRDLARLGPLAGRLEPFDIAPLLGNEHTFLGSVAHPTIARRMAPYTWMAPLP